MQRNKGGGGGGGGETTSILEVRRSNRVEVWKRGKACLVYVRIANFKTREYNLRALHTKQEESGNEDFENPSGVFRPHYARGI